MKAIGKILIITACGLAAFFFFVSCKKKAAVPVPPDALATVGSNVITVAEFQRALAGRGNSIKAPMQPEVLLEDLIRFEAMYAKALADGYDRRPDMMERWRRMLVAQYRLDQLGDGENLPAVSDDEIRESYETNRAAFVVSGARRANVIFVSTPRAITQEKRQEFRLRAETILQEARDASSTEALTAVVTRSSEHQATRYRAGDVGWIVLEDKTLAWPPAVIAAIFKIGKAGDFASVVDTEGGFYVVRLAEERAAQVRSLENVREIIRYRIAREKQSRREADLFSKAKSGLAIQINYDLLESTQTYPVTYETNPSRPPPLPGQDKTR